MCVGFTSRSRQGLAPDRQFILQVMGEVMIGERPSSLTIPGQDTINFSAKSLDDEL